MQAAFERNEISSQPLKQAASIIVVLLALANSQKSFFGKLALFVYIEV